MQYLMTITELKAAAVVNLGAMNQGTYASFKARADAEAQKHGFARARLVVDLKYKSSSDFGVTEQPYPISADEWDLFIREAPSMLQYMPQVFVVDGDKFTAPI